MISGLIAAWMGPGQLGSFQSALIVMGSIMISIVSTLCVSRFLSSTILTGMPSHFILEMPPYRKPQVLQVVVRSIFDKTLSVLGRAVVVAAPAGLAIWLMQNINVGPVTILAHVAGILDPLGRMLGMDGVILTAFILGMPANEIVIPIMLMIYSGADSLGAMDGFLNAGELLAANGWTTVTAVCTMLFSIHHFPCTTTLLTIKKETAGIKWTAAAFLIPTIVGMGMCFMVALIAGAVSGLL